MREWRGCDFVQPVEAQCVAVADEQLQKIMAQQPVSPANLKKYISLWEGFAVVQQAGGHYEKLAGEALEKIRQLSTPEAKNAALKSFIVDWAPASSTVYQAQQMREELATTELAAIKQIKAKGTMKAKLGDFIRSYEGTAAGSEARTMAGSR